MRISSGNEKLVASLEASGVLRTKRIIEAFLAVDRAYFVPREMRDDAYIDAPLPIGYNQTISQPYTVAFTLEQLAPEAGEKILDVGSGSGWTTALLAHIVGQSGSVYGVEVVSELVEFGRKNLERYEFPWATITEAGGSFGLPEKAPFDRILVSASAQKTPDELIEQLKVGGRLVIPIRTSIWKIDKVSEGETENEEFPGFAFVPLIKK